MNDAKSGADTGRGERRAAVSRRKLARSPLETGGGFAWRWIYDVTGDDGASIAYGVRRLDSAERIARRAGYRPERSWTPAARAHSEPASK